jgi:hypothetical protein
MVANQEIQTRSIVAKARRLKRSPECMGSSIGGEADAKPELPR